VSLKALNRPQQRTDGSTLKKTPTKSIDIKHNLGARLSFESIQNILWPPNQIELSATYFGQFSPVLPDSGKMNNR
jgi:hypothetical protein